MTDRFAPLIPDQFNMAAYVLAHADRSPDKIALSIVSPRGAQRWSYRQIKQAVLGLAHGFLDMGLTAGDRVLLRIGNTVEYPLVYLAALAVDLVPVPTSAQLSSHEVAKIITEVTPALIVHDPAVATADADCPVLSTVELPALYTGIPAEFVMGDPNRLGYLVYTSGTSGHPRAVMHAHRAILARQMMHRDWYDLSEHDRLLHAGAFNWTFTLGTGLMDPWSVGASAVIPVADTAPDVLPLLMKRHDATLFAAAPGVYRKILDRLDAPIHFPKLRHCLSAGEKLSPRIASRWAAMTGQTIYEAFGMSECSTFISASPHRPAHGDVLGYPQCGRRVAILPADPDAGQMDGPVPKGTDGIIAIHNSDPGLMLGYWNAPQATAEKMRNDWFLTGDFGAQQPDGSIAYLGRRDDMMNAGGIRVSPIEIERELSQVAGIRTVAVTDVEVKADVSIIVAFYTAEHDIADATLAAFCHDRLASYKIPRKFVRVAELPTNPNGKINRRALKQRTDIFHGET